MRRCLATTLLALLLSVVTAACNANVPGAPESSTAAPSSPGTTTAPSPSPSPSASPTPDVAAAAIGQLERLRSGRLEFAGDMRVSGGELPLAGEHEISGSDSRTLFTIGSDGRAVSTVTIAVDGETFTSTNDGPFFRLAEEPAAPSGGTADPQGLMRSLVRLQDDGVERRNGQSLHRLVLPRGVAIAPGDIGFDDPAMSDVNADITVYARPDGTPVEMELEVAWQQEIDGESAPAELRVIYRFEDVNEPVAIERPDDVWAHHASDRYGYRIAHPEDWEVEEIESDDEFENADSLLSPGGDEVVIYTETGWGSLNEYATATILGWQEQLGTRPEENEAISLGGEPGRILTYHGEVDGLDSFVLDAVTVRDGTAFTATWYSVPGAEAADAKVFRAMLSTLEFE